MDIIPAIDVLEGRCVRLRQGNFEDVTVFGDDVVETAKRWKDSGAGILHLVDLDGARTGSPANLGLVEEISQKIGLNVELGGGLRSIESIRSAFSAGAYRVVVGTLPFIDPETVRSAAEEYSGRIVAGLDCKGDQVVVNGWIQSSGMDLVSAIGFLKGLGLETFIYTDVARDGMMAGPSILGLSTVLSTGVKVITSGGIATINDIKCLLPLENQGLVGAIIGKALYEGAIDLREAIELGQGGSLS
jgi:phosphoribosylformimino-5-aminoimidazole carboxamide ribotide isomerase